MVIITRPQTGKWFIQQGGDQTQCDDRAWEIDSKYSSVEHKAAAFD